MNEKTPNNIQLEMIMGNKSLAEALPGLIERGQLNAQLLFSKYKKTYRSWFYRRASNENSLRKKSS